MKEYIERERLKEAFNANLQTLQSLDEHTMNLILIEIDEAPAADVAEVVHGKWEPGNPICPVCGENKFKDLDADVWADWQPKFCPNCGARMGKEDEQ